METRHFDRLARALTEIGTRRGLLTCLLSLPLVGGLIAFLAPNEVDADGRHKWREVGAENHKRKGRRRKHRQKDKRKHKHKHCKPHSMAETCAGTCGVVKNNCKKTTDCGPCACEPACDICLICQEEPNTPGACVPDLDLQGQSCGDGGHICCDGSCVTGLCCDPSLCTTPEAPDCVFNQCVCAGQANQPCVSGRTCCTTGCTNLQTDAANCGACGTVCSGATPVCWDGACVCGDVCPSSGGCQFDSVEDAVDAAPAGSTVTICAGDYVTSVNVFKPLTLRGAGADATTLRGPGDFRTMEVRDVVLVQDLTITGGNADLGGGILNRGTLTLAGVLVTGNGSSVNGGGIVNFLAGGSPLLVLDNSHVTLNTAVSSGGGIATAGGQVRLTNGSTVTNNMATDGGGIFINGGTATLEPGTLVCDNSEPQCTGFTPPSGFCGACP